MLLGPRRDAAGRSRADRGTGATDAIARRGRFLFCLAGGATPKPLYELLASAPFATRIEWPRVHVFWGDERCVPPDHPESNYRMAREALLDHVPLPATNIHRIRGEDEPSKAAAAYEELLGDFFGRLKPRRRPASISCSSAWARMATPPRFFRAAPRPGKRADGSSPPLDRSLTVGACRSRRCSSTPPRT